MHLYIVLLRGQKYYRIAIHARQQWAKVGRLGDKGLKSIG